MHPFQHGGHLLKDYGSMAAVLAAGGPEITYLLDVVFADYADDSAPVASPIVGREGQLTVVQTDGTFAITSGQLVFTAQSTPAWGDQSIYDATALTRAAGLTAFFKGVQSTRGQLIGMGYWPDTNIDATVRYAPYSLSNNYNVLKSGSNVAISTAYLANDSLEFWNVARNETDFVFQRIASGDLILKWPYAYASGDTILYTGLANYDAAGTVDLIRAASLPTNATYPVPALGTRDLDLSTPGTGTGTSSIAAPAVGNTFQHTADFQLDFDLTTLPSADYIRVLFRVDAPNFWEARLRTNGNFQLYNQGGEVSSAVGVLSGGEHITVKVNNETITGYYNGTLAWTYVSATLNKDKIGGSISSLGTGGVIANLTAKTLDGVANVSSTNHPGYGLATNVLPGPRAAGNTFTHEADCVWEFMVDALPSSGTPSLWFRIQDATHYWFVWFDSSGNFRLSERDGGAPVVRASAIGVLSGGERIVVVTNGTTIKGYYNTTLGWTYSSATNFQTATSGEINTLGTGGRVSNLITWPLNLASAPNTPEASNIAAAFDLMATP